MPRRATKAKSKAKRTTKKRTPKAVKIPKPRKQSKKSTAQINSIQQMTNAMSKPQPIITKQMVMEALVRMFPNLYRFYNGNLLQFTGSQWVSATNVPGNHVQQARNMILSNMK